MQEMIRQLRERALASPVRREILEALGRDGLRITELRAELSVDLTLVELNFHLATLQDVDLVWAEGGRYWSVAR